MIGRITSAIGGAGGDIGAIDIARSNRNFVVRDYTINACDEAHSRSIADAVRDVDDCEVMSMSDRTFLLHLGGKITVENKVELKTRDELSMAYTPGVARVCTEIANDHEKAYRLTIKANTVAVVTDGTAVLGLGDIGPEAALPVMEGKAMLFRRFGGLSAFPICLATKDVDEIVETVVRISPGFGGINLEDISSPRCFEIEERLKATLDIPVFHDDQHGTAVVVLAGLMNSLKLVGKKFEDIKAVVCGAGAAGTACAKLLLSAGVRNIVVVDTAGAIYKSRPEHMNDAKRALAAMTNPHDERGKLSDVMTGADFFLGVSSPDLVTPEMLKKMSRDPVVFALSNPNPEISPDLAQPHARVVATGRSDYMNQINNVLCFPGLFRGLLRCRASVITKEMLVAVADAIASVVSDDELTEDYIIPSVFDKRVAERVSTAVIKTAIESGLARSGLKEDAE
jgi:malate dehydrogenase (oxaloacetate-decarboxylating)